MSIFDIFKKKPKYWDAYKKFLITECRIPFNTLLSLEKRCDNIVAEIASGGKNRIEVCNIDEDNRMLLEMGIAAKASDKKYATTLLANDGKLTMELAEALALWIPKDGTIAIGSYTPGKKGKDVCIDLFCDHVPACGNAIVVVDNEKL